MCIKNRIIALIFRCLLVLGCGMGLYLNSGLPQGQFKPSMFVYYTILSNAVCFLFYIILSVKTGIELKKDGVKGITKLVPHFKGAIIMMIMVTMLVYHFILVPQAFSMNTNYIYFSLSNILVHYFTPLMVIIDWLLFDKKNVYRWFDPLIWLTIPYVYFGFALFRAEIGGVLTGVNSRYPYFFIDVDVLGWGGVLKYVVVVSLAFIILGYFLYFIDKIRYKRYQ